MPIFFGAGDFSAPRHSMCSTYPMTPLTETSSRHPQRRTMTPSWPRQSPLQRRRIAPTSTAKVRQKAVKKSDEDEMADLEDEKGKTVFEDDNVKSWSIPRVQRTMSDTVSD